jgi:hypothetical protein
MRAYFRPVKLFIYSLISLQIALADPAEKIPANAIYLENEIVKIGVNKDSGGSIFWFSSVAEKRNYLNHYDRGRFIQQSYYGKADGSIWAKKSWRWNPVQGGDYKGKPAKVIEEKKDATSLYIKSIPVHWATGQELTDCTMEEWITLNKEVAKIRFRFTYMGKETHTAQHQELPAVFVDAAFAKLHYYKGDQPWKNAPTTADQPGWPNESRTCDEEWAAYTNEKGHGIGVFFPGKKSITCYRFGGPRGPSGSGCSYFAPVSTMTIKPSFVHDYTIYLSIGSVEEIRNRFKSIHETNK